MLTFNRRFLAISVMLAALGACIVPAKRPAAPAVDHTAEWQATCADVYKVELGREIDPGGLVSCLAMAKSGKDKAGIVAVIDASPEHAEHVERLAHPPVNTTASMDRLAVDGGRIFHVDGQPWRWKGISAFQLLDRFAHGEDIQPFLDAYQGFNIARVWLYVDWTPEKNGGAQGWDWPSPDVAVAFLQRMEASGWYVEITLLTNDDPARIEPAKAFIAAFKAAQPDNLVLEIGNEPATHKSIHTDALIPDLVDSGFLFATGDYENAERMRGRYGVTHTARRPDFPRYAHDLMEFYNGGGPNDKSDPPHLFPIVADEPGKLEDVGTDAAAWRAYFGGTALMGAGATFHCETCKYAKLPTDAERSLAAVALDALNAFPADAPLGPYRRVVEPGQSDSARTYVVGPYMVRSQQRGTSAPEAGWTPIDSDGILWRKQ